VRGGLREGERARAGHGDEVDRAVGRGRELGEAGELLRSGGGLQQAGEFRNGSVLGHFAGSLRGVPVTAVLRARR
jgi:hypothetical protein